MEGWVSDETVAPCGLRKWNEIIDPYQAAVILDLKRGWMGINNVLKIINNYSPKWRWIVVDIYRAIFYCKYPSLFTDTEVNNCFSVYHTSWINSRLMTEKGLFSGGLLRCRSARGERFFIVKCSVSSSCRQIKLLQALVKLLRSHFLNGWV